MALVTVLSASGRPGLAQVRQLIKAGYEVRGTTRNPERLSQFNDITYFWWYITSKLIKT